MAEATTLEVWIVLATCCRIGELLKARWDHVDLERKCWRIPAQNSKNNREHTVYLSCFAVCHFVKFKELEELEKVYKRGRPSYALVIYGPEISDQIDELEVDADFVVCLPDNGRDDLSEEIPKGGYRVFF